MTSLDRLTDALRDAGKTVTVTGDKATAQCVAHDDNRASLSIGPRKDGNGVVLYCHAGCDFRDVLAALKLAPRDLFDDDRLRAAYSDRATYSYPDGRKVYRKPSKKFHQSGNTKGTSLFHVDSITADTTTVHVVEGEKDVLAAECTGAIAVCPAMGAGKAAKFDWSPLTGKHVVIVADADEPGRKHAGEIAALLAGIAAPARIVQAKSGKDLADHIAAGHTVDELVDITDEFTVNKTDAGTPMGKPQKRAITSQLVDMARQQYTFGVTETGEPLAVDCDRPHLALMLRGGRLGLRANLARRYFAEHQTVAGQQALTDACLVLEGYAAQENPQRVHLRVAEHVGDIYIDIGDPAGRVIRIGGGCWDIGDTAPVLFKRTNLSAAMPGPVAGGDLGLLWRYVNIDDADRPVLLAAMVATLVQPDVPHVIMALEAENGSAKSSITRALVDLLDPSTAPLHMPPRDVANWVHTANGSWVVAVDNVSFIPNWFSDALCRASTGDAMVSRQLYTDDDLAVIAFRRVVILTGIDLGGIRGDLADRLVRVRLPRIVDRRPEAELAADWARDRPQILGGLLDLAAAVHKRLLTISIDGLPRMADYALALSAVDAERGTAGFDHYRGRAAMLAAETLTNPFIVALMAARMDLNNKTSGELLALLTPAEKDWRPPRDWPKNARAVTGQLTRNAAAMRTQGWVVDNDGGHNHSNVTQWTINPPKERLQS